MRLRSRIFSVVLAARRSCSHDRLVARSQEFSQFCGARKQLCLQKLMRRGIDSDESTLCAPFIRTRAEVIA